MDPLPPELPPRAPLDEPDGRIIGGGGASLGTPFAETPDATGEFGPRTNWNLSDKYDLDQLNVRQQLHAELKEPESCGSGFDSPELKSLYSPKLDSCRVL